MCALLPKVGHIERDSTLPLRFVQDLVHSVQQCHIMVHLGDCFLVQLENVRELKNEPVHEKMVRGWKFWI